MIESDGALAAEVGLEIGHEESGGDAFAGYIGDDEAEALAAEIEEIVVVAADMAGRETETGKFESFERRQSLGEEAGLHLLGDFEFLSSAALGFEFLGRGAALGFNGVSDFVETDEGERVAVGIFETGEDTAPDGRRLGGR